jgi:beta-glucosidase
MNRTSRTMLVLGAAGLVIASSAPMQVAPRAASAAPRPAAANTSARTAMPWLNARQSPSRRAGELLARMSLADKVHLLHGVSIAESPVPTDGFISAVPRLGIPPITMSDGPAGIRNGQRATELPAPIALAASWDTHLAKAYGGLIGREARALGQDQVFGPAMNIDRDPRDGRDFEYLSEDPLLSGFMAGAEVKGIQSHGVIATVKHYVANNSETNRGYISADVSQRALHEIYEKNFGVAVAFGHPGSAMCSYNRINSVYACSDPQTLGDLRHVFGFNGYVVSDYPATHRTTDLARGMNIELPRARHFTLQNIRNALATGQLGRGQINRRVEHILKVLFQYGIFDRALKTSRIAEKQDAEEARRVEEQGAVLLRNTGILPLGSRNRRIAVIGSTAEHAAQGTGSSRVQALSLDNGVRAIAGLARRVVGRRARVTYASGSSISRARVVAARAGVAIVFARNYEGEGFDRTTLALPRHENRLVSAVAAANPNSVVVLETGGPVLLPWLNRVKAVLEAWYPGERGGHAIARLLYGKVNPSGKLQQTWPRSNSQLPDRTRREFPGVDGNEHYSEGVDVGYRWYYDHSQRPRYPFGYGLTYSRFRYSHLSLSRSSGTSRQRFRISFSVKNTGRRSGRDIVEVYINKPNRSVHTPNHELAAFAKVWLRRGRTARVRMRVGPRELAYWAIRRHAFAVQRGSYRIMVGGSSRRLPLTARYRVTRRIGTLAFG